MKHRIKTSRLRRQIQLFAGCHVLKEESMVNGKVEEVVKSMESFILEIEDLIEESKSRSG